MRRSGVPLQLFARSAVQPQPTMITSRINHCWRPFHHSSTAFFDKRHSDRLLESQKVTSLLDHLDENVDTDDLRRVRSERKLTLNKSLLQPRKKILSPASQGQMDAFGDRLADDMNLYLSKIILFRPRRENDARFVSRMTGDQVVDITTVSLNQDQSHAHAYWSSEPITIMLQKLVAASQQYMIQSHRPEVAQSIQRKAHVGPKHPLQCYEFAQRAESRLTKKLQDREGGFRSHIIRTINMRRVPRIFFAPDKSTKMLMAQLKAIVDLHTERDEDA
eukprot:gene9299-6661_t